MSDEIEISYALDQELASWHRIFVQINGADSIYLLKRAAAQLWQALEVDRTVNPDAHNAARAVTVDSLNELAQLGGIAPDDAQAIFAQYFKRQELSVNVNVVISWPAPQPSPRLLTSGAFVQDFKPPDYLVNGILQRRFIYSMTGRTGEGKTAVCLRIAAHVAEGIPLNGEAVSSGRVLYLAGENPDDIRMRWIVLMERMGLDENKIAVDFIDGRFSLSEIPRHIISVAKEKRYALVIVDTSAAFSESADENDNIKQGQQARTLRSLIDILPGGPTILACCHPPKNAADDNLQPRGGGAFIAEFDGNLTCRKTEAATEVHWQGKFRGPDFAPMHFLLEGATTARLKDTNGNAVWTVFAKPSSEQDQEEITRALKSDAAQIMAVIRDEPGISLADIARRMGWHNKQMLPDKSKAQKRIRTLEKKRLVERDDDVLELTDKGKAWLAKQSKNKGKS